MPNSKEQYFVVERFNDEMTITEYSDRERTKPVGIIKKDYRDFCEGKEGGG